MTINLADDAIHTLNRAAAAAARQGGEAIGPRHILAGVVSQRDPALLEVLGDLTLDLEALPARLRDLPETYEGHLPFTPASHEVLAVAVESASASGAGATTSVHLLLGVARAGGPESRTALEAWGLDGDALEAALAPDPVQEDGAESGSALHRTSSALSTVALLIAPLLACGAPADRGAEVPAEDPFAATPADGPVPEIGPAPDDYRPTAAGAPSTDIWVGWLDRGEGGALAVRDLINATDRDGYDNQPSFDPAGSAIYYTVAADATQTETFRYLLDSRAREQVTHTSGASEFSPTSIPGQDAFSAIREVRGRQYLWRYGTNGSDLGPIFATVEPVGYHAWADERTTVMFVLGDPATLQVGDALSGDIRVVAESPGRSVHRIPGSGDISFVRKVADGDWWIERLDPATGETERITQTLPGREDYAWTPTGEILMGDGASLFGWTAEGGWSQVAELDGEGAGDISRLAVSPDGSRIAVVRSR